MKKILGLIIFSTALVCAPNLHARTYTQIQEVLEQFSSRPYDSLKYVADSLSALLPSAKTPEDSLALLHDIAECNSVAHAKDSIGLLAVNLALRIGDSHTGLHLLRHRANLHTRDGKLLQRDIDTAMKFPDSEEKSKTIVFLRMLKNMNEVSYGDDNTKSARISRLLETMKSGSPQNIYDRIATLHALTLYVAEFAPGEFLEDYMKQLEYDVNELSDSALFLQNCFLMHGAMAYTQAEMHDKAVELDRKLLVNLHGLANGDIVTMDRFRDYDVNKYVVYSRLLSNYPYLSKKEVEEYYAEVKKLVGQDPRTYDVFTASPRAELYYLMANENYAEALKFFRLIVDNETNNLARRRLLKMMITAAKGAGDTEALIYASQAYNDILENTLAQRTAEKVRQIQSIYDMRNLREENAERESELSRHTLIVAIVSAGVLFILLIVMILMYRHSLKIGQHLKRSNSALREESANLQRAKDELVTARDEAQKANNIKSDFIKNMSSEVSTPLHVICEYSNLVADCVEATEQSYLRRFSDLISFNADLLNTMMTDLLNLSEIEANTIQIESEQVDVLRICRLVVDGLRHLVKPGVELKLREGLRDITICTDRNRLSQILYQLISNAAKFTVRGSITLTYNAHPELNRIEISVIDTGIGIPPESAEKIFQRFVKLDSASQGAGIGLAVARGFAKLLGGNILLRSSSEYGSEFVLTLPINNSYSSL